MYFREDQIQQNQIESNLLSWPIEFELSTKLIHTKPNQNVVVKTARVNNFFQIPGGGACCSFGGGN